MKNFNVSKFRCNKDRRKSSTGSTRSKLSSTGDSVEVGELPVSPQALNSPAPLAEPSRQVIQDNPGDVSDDDQMVICEETGAVEIDLKCKEKVTDSDSESQSDLEAAENRSFPQQRFSPVSNKTGTDVTYRPKPIKAIMPTSENSAKYSPAPTSNTFHYSPVNPSGISGFQPTGGAFKQAPQAKQSVIQMGDNHNQNNQFANQPVTVAIFTGQPALCLSNDSERSQPVVVVASTPSDHPVQYVYMPPPPFTVADSNGRNLSAVQLVSKASTQTTETKKEFKLAPTPAQLGKAPLQRRQSMGKTLDLMLPTCQSLSIFPAPTTSNNNNSQPSSEPTTPLPPPNNVNSQSDCLISPVTKKSLFKRNKEDGMDK